MKDWIVQPVLYLVAVVWFCMFPIACISCGHFHPRQLYIDENALSPFSHEPKRYIDENLCQSCTHERFLDILKKKCIVHELQSRHLETNKTTHIQSVWIKPVSNSEMKESIVFVLNKTQCKEFNAGVLNAILHVQSSIWLGKQLIFLFPTPFTDFAVEAWLDSVYQFKKESDFKHIGTMPDPKVIRQALSIDMTQCTQPFQVGLDVGGASPRLPNLDLVSLVAKLFSKRAIPLPTRKAVQQYNDLFDLFLSCTRKLEVWSKELKLSVDFMPVKIWMKEMASMLVWMWNSAINTGPHSAFLSANIDSMTVRQIDDLKTIHNSVDISQYIERIVHSLNNLEEKLHHSVPYYQLVDDESFVDPGEISIPPIIAFLSGSIPNFLFLKKEPISRIFVSTSVCMVSILSAYSFCWLFDNSPNYFFYKFLGVMGIGVVLFRTRPNLIIEKQNRLTLINVSRVSLAIWNLLIMHLCFIWCTVDLFALLFFLFTVYPVIAIQFHSLNRVGVLWNVFRAIYVTFMAFWSVPIFANRSVIHIEYLIFAFLVSLFHLWLHTFSVIYTIFYKMTD